MSRKSAQTNKTLKTAMKKNTKYGLLTKSATALFLSRAGFAEAQLIERVVLEEHFDQITNNTPLTALGWDFVPETAPAQVLANTNGPLSGSPTDGAICGSCSPRFRQSCVYKPFASLPSAATRQIVLEYEGFASSGTRNSGCSLNADVDGEATGYVGWFAGWPARGTNWGFDAAEPTGDSGAVESFNGGFGEVVKAMTVVDVTNRKVWGRLLGARGLLYETRHYDISALDPRAYKYVVVCQDTRETAYQSGLDIDNIKVTLVEHRPTLSMRTSQVELGWSSETNALYNIQFRSDLTTNAWTTLATNIVGNGTTNYFFDSVPRGEPQRFYRVEVLR